MFWSKATPEKDEKKEATEEGPSAISDITHSVLDTYLGATWRRRGFKHLTFRSEVFNLQSLDGLLQQPVDLTFLESLDVSENSLKELDCIAGTSARLKEFPQGVLIFGSLQVLKVRKNLLTGFMARLPMLRELDLGHNRLEDVPQGLGLLPKLEVLLLDHNQIGGTLAAVRKAQALKKLDLSSNQFDFRATQLYEQLENLEGMVSLALKLKDNPFCTAVPPYQILCLQKLPQLRKLDDISNMAQAREAAGRSELNLRALDELAYKNQELKVDHTTQAAKGPLAVFRPANKKTVFAELADFFARALNDPSPQIAVAGLTRLTHTISQCIPADMANLREELRKGPPAKKRIDAMIRDINLLMAKVKGPNQKILILRAVAKLSVIDEFEIGDNCMDALRGFAQKHPELEEKILGMLQEMIIGPLQETYMVVADPRDQRVFSFLRILSHFDSPKFGAALRNIANELSDMCCKLVKEVGGHYTEIGILMQKWSSCAENLQVEPVIGFGELLATILACLDLEMNAPDPSEDAKESSAMLGIALNMLRSNNPTAVKVFLVTSATKPAFYTRIMKMIMQVFGHSKKADTLPTVSALKNGANSKILAGLFDVMGALIALPGVDDLVEEIIHGHEYRGQLMKYMSCVLEDEMMSAPLAFAGALRLCWRLLIAYEPRKDWKGENVVTECITALHEMRILMELLSMKGESFDRLWKACSGGSEVNAKPVNLHEPEVIEIFEAIIKLVTFFSPLEGMLYAEVRRVVSASREELMFQMITVPHPSVKNAALECISAASISDYSSSEMESLISLLEVKPEELQASFMLLEKIMSQLNKMLLANTGQGALSLRTTHGNVAMEGVIRVFVRTSRSRPDTAELSKMRVELLQACLRFFRITETMAEWRQHRLRTKNASLAVITALQSEDQDALGLDIPDISAERTWTGRSVETLLLCLTGPERLKANSKVTFRVISRMADVLDGHSDFLERPRASSDPEMEKDAEKLHTRLMAEEAKPWDEEAMRKRLGFLDNMEEEDRRLQQEIFTSANGLERIDMFLGGLYPNHKARNTARLREVAAVQEGTRMIEQSTIGATKSEASEDHPESDSESETSQAGVRRPEAPVIELVARDFAGTRDLAGYDDLRQTFAGRLHSCVSILFTARWDSFNNWSSIIDFGNGPAHDNITIANQGRFNSLVFEVYRFGKPYRVIAPGVLKLGEPCTYLCTVSEDGVMQVLRGSEVIGQCNGLPPSEALPRKYLYVAKSCWPERDMFHGRLEQLKVYNGLVVDWDDVVTDAGEENAQFDRRLLVKEFFYGAVTQDHPLPRVHGASNLLPDHADEEEHFAPSGHLEPGYTVAALMRCCFALLQVPASNKAEADMVATLLDKNTVSRMLSLVRLCGPFQCCVGIKFLHLMGAALQYRLTDPDVEMLLVCKIVMDYACEVVEDAVRALKYGDRQRELGRLLTEKIAKFCAAMCSSLQYLEIVDEDAQWHARFVEQCLDQLVPPSLVTSIVQMALFADDGIPSQIQMVGDTRSFLVKLIERCPSRQRDTWQVLCTMLMSGDVDSGFAWLSELVDEVAKSHAERIRQEQAAKQAFGAQKVTFEDGHPERSLGSYFVEVQAFDARLRASNQSGANPFVSLVITNKALRLVDTTVPGYPTEATGQIQDCSWDLTDLVRITRGFLAQDLFLSIRRKGSVEEGASEGVVACVFHRAKDRDDAIGKLHQLKLVPVEEDGLMEEAMKQAVPEEALQAIHCSPEAGTFFVDDGFKVFVLTQTGIHHFEVNYTQWRPKAEPAITEGKHHSQPSAASKIPTELKAIRDSTDKETTPAVWATAKHSLLTRLAPMRLISKLDQVSFYPDSRPRIEMTFQDGEGLTIIFFDETSKEKWRESMLDLLHEEGDGTSWSRNAASGLPGDEGAGIAT